MRSKSTGIKGIILNHYHEGDMMEQDNITMIEHMTGVPVIACIKEGEREITGEIIL